MFGKFLKDVKKNINSNKKMDDDTLILLILWIWGLLITIKFWKEIPTWAKVLAIIGLVVPFLGPVLTIIVVYISRK